MGMEIFNLIVWSIGGAIWIVSKGKVPKIIFILTWVALMVNLIANFYN